jgi:hypothetical protein
MNISLNTTASEMQLFQEEYNIAGFWVNHWQHCEQLSTVK